MLFSRDPRGLRCGAVSMCYTSQGETSAHVREQVEAAVGAWHASGAFTQQTLLRSEELARRFSRRLDAQGVASMSAVTEAHCQGFIDAPTREGKDPELAE